MAATPAPTPSPAAIGLSTIDGLPAHILIVHAVVVLVPLSAIALITALKPTLARRLGWWLPLLAAAAFVSVLAAMSAGGWLENHVQDSALVRAHTRIAGQLWPFSAAVLLLSIVLWRANAPEGYEGAAPAEVTATSAGGMATTVIVAVLSVLVAVGSVVQVVRIGDSGSRASWQDHFSHASTRSGSPG
jgi:Na+-translocating ferredoxin:NAD+ oxidoreductase RnfA subunit